jgi:hypothetical protein
VPEDIVSDGDEPEKLIKVAVLVPFSVESKTPFTVTVMVSSVNGSEAEVVKLSNILFPASVALPNTADSILFNVYVALP